VDVKRINEQVKRNIDRFPEQFKFQLSENEWDYLRSQIETLKNNRGKHRKYLPYVFTEQGVAMLSAVLRSETAIKISTKIIQAFVEMRKIIAENALIFQRLDKLEKITLQTEVKFEKIFKALENKELKPDKGIFFDGQVFDAYTYIADLIRKAENSIILIDNYVDDSVLTFFEKRKSGVTFTIYTNNISKQLTLDIKKFNTQYEPIEVFEMKLAHDRFLIIDKTELYHIGASLKDLGKKWFAFSKMDAEVLPLLSKIQEYNLNI